MNTPRIDFQKYQHLIDRMPKPKHQTDRIADVTDVYDAQEAFKQVYHTSIGLLDMCNSEVRYFNNLKELSTFQKRKLEKEIATINTLELFTQAVPILGNYLQVMSSQAYKDLAAAAEDEISVLIVMNDRMEQLKKDIDSLKQELQAKEEIIQLLTDLV